MTYIDLSDSSQGVVRSPRAWLKVDGALMPCITADVTKKAERSTDTFSAELSIDETALSGFGYAEWADWQAPDVEILMAENAGDSPTSLVTGKIDAPLINWSECTVAISGRNKGATLTETARSQSFKNQMSSDIATTIAQDHGLTPVVTPGSDFAGKLYDVDTMRLVMNVTDHDVMNDLAGREGMRWYVDGSNLVLEPRGTEADTFNVEWVPPDGKSKTAYATCTDLKTHRNMTAAKPHTVTVRSWHHKDKKHYDGQAQADGVGDAVEIEHHHNGRTQAQVDKISASRLKNAIRHDCNVVVTMPGDLSVSPRQKLNLTGTGTIYDQLYDIDVVHFTCGWNDGLTMEIDAKIAKSGRTGTDDTGATKDSPTNVPLPPPRPATN